MFRKLCALLVMALVAFSAPVRAEDDAGKIAFQSLTDQTADLFVVTLDSGPTTPPTNLTHNGDINVFPSWSPDGRRVVFQRQHLDPDLPRPIKNGHNQIYVMDADGSNQTNLTNDPDGDYYLPSWSPDGKHILYVSGHGDNKNYDIYVMDADGSNRVRLTPQPGSNSYPQWSPDGKHILFESGRDNSRGGIYVMDSDGSNVQQLTFAPRAGGFSGQATWSPDGSKIVFISGFTDGPKSAIYVMNLRDKQTTRLTDAALVAQYPHWSPDGRFIVFQVSATAGSNQDSIYVMNADGSNAIKVAEGFGPAWVR